MPTAGPEPTDCISEALSGARLVTGPGWSQPVQGGSIDEGADNRVIVLQIGCQDDL